MFSATIAVIVKNIIPKAEFISANSPFLFVSSKFKISQTSLGGQQVQVIEEEYWDEDWNLLYDGQAR
jgi:hypothetical protein